MKKIRPILKKNGIAAFAFPGMKYEIKENVPPEMKPFWEEEALKCGIPSGGGGQSLRMN